MSESAGTNAAPPLKKKGMKPMMIVAIVIVIAVALIAVVVLGGFLNNKDNTKNLLQKIKANGKIVVGTQVPYPPFEDYNMTSGKYEGIDIEIIQLVADRLGVTLEIKAMEFDPLFGAVQTGIIDCAISSVTITEERLKLQNFSVPYYVANQAVLVKESSSIHDIDGLNGTKVVAQLGTTGEAWAVQFLVDDGRISSGDLAHFSDVPAAVTTVENGQNAAFIVDTPVADKYANDASYNLKVGYVIQTNENYGIMMPNGEPELKAAIDKIISDLIADGTIAQILSKWM
jgi:ABC-type amino acid transport substrate-binding protein